MSEIPQTLAEVEVLVKQSKDKFLSLAVKMGVDFSVALKMWDLAETSGRWAGYTKAAEEVQARMKALGFSLLAVVALASCSDARSSGRPEAERVFVPDAGYVCFLVRDEDGRAVGGNCLRDP